MSQPALDFTGGPPPRLPRATRRPLLVSGRAPVARQASADGALLNARHRETQCTELSTYLDNRGLNGATDAEIESDLGWPPNVVTARRNDLARSGDVCARWPEPRRKSVTTGVMVVVWISTRVIRNLAPAGSRSRTEDHREGAAATPISGQRTTKGNQPPRAGESPESARQLREPKPGIVGVKAEVVTAGETAPEIDIPLAGPSSADEREQAARPHSPRARHAATDRGGQPGETGADLRAMTLVQLCGVKEGTRVRLADGRFGQLTTVSTHRSEAYIYVFSTRGYRALKPEHLADRRETDGELVERSS